MTTITLPPEIEAPLSEAARQQGITTELLAVESLRQMFPPASPAIESENAKSLYDFLADHVGVIQGSGDAFSENCGQRFADGLLEKHKATGS